jgi:hypothetical protein
MDWLFNAFFLWVPLWVWVLLVLVAVAIIFKVFGWKQSLVAAAAFGTFLLYTFGVKQGAEAKTRKDIRDAQKTIDKARAARAAADRHAADPDRVFDDDGHRRD